MQISYTEFLLNRAYTRGKYGQKYIYVPTVWVSTATSPIKLTHSIEVCGYFLYQISSKTEAKFTKYKPNSFTSLNAARVSLNRFSPKS